MIKLFEVALAQNGWVVTVPPEDDDHTQRDSLYLDDRDEIQDMLYDLVQELAIDMNRFTVKISVKKVKP